MAAGFGYTVANVILPPFPAAAERNVMRVRQGMFVLLICSVLLSFPARARAAGLQHFLILYSNSVHGEIEPCG